MTRADEWPFTTIPACSTRSWGTREADGRQSLREQDLRDLRVLRMRALREEGLQIQVPGVSSLVHGGRPTWRTVQGEHVCRGDDNHSRDLELRSKKYKIRLRTVLGLC